MTYTASEVSVRGGRPNELYKFAGTYSTYLYTSGPLAVQYDDGSLDEEGDPLGPETYLPIAIQRSAISAGTQEDDNLDLTITISVKHQLVLDYGFQDTPPLLQLSIYRYHSMDDVRPFWYGPVNNIQVTNGKAQIRSYSKLAAALSQQFPNVYYQAPCNHVLYDQRCGVSYAANSASLAVTVIAGRTLTFAAIPDDLVGKLLGGEVKLSSGERRMITRSTDTTVTVNFPFSLQALAVYDEVTIAKGCDLAYLGDCKAFGAQLNFGGFPFIPSENPFTTGIDPNNLLDDATCPPPAYHGPQTVYHYYQDNPCNPDYGATRQLYFPETQPNAPHGKILSSFNGLPLNGLSYLFEYDDYINPLSEHYQDPAYSNCRGQKLVTFEMSNLDWVVTFDFLVAVGAWTQVVQYPAFFCSSVGKPDGGNQKISVCRATPPELCAATVVIDQIVAGNVPYHLEFEF